MLNDTEAVVIVCDAANAEKARGLAASVAIPHVLVLGEDGIELARWIDDAAITLPENLPGSGDPASMFFTGGTTGVPKGAEHRHSSMIAYCLETASLWDMDFDAERILSVAPMFHIWGHHFTVVFPLYLRATLVMVPQY